MNTETSPKRPHSTLDERSSRYLARVKRTVLSKPSDIALLAVVSLAAGASWALGYWLDGLHIAEAFWSWIGLSAVVFVALSIAMLWLAERQFTVRREAFSRKLFWTAFIVIAASFTLTWLLNFPGTCSSDSMDSIRIALGEMPWSNAHPVMYTALLTPFVLLGDATGNMALGVAAHSVVQLAAMAGVLSYACCWLKRQAAPDLAVLAVLAFFAFNPIIARYATTMWKDVPFSLCMLLFALQLIEIALTRGRALASWRQCVKLAALALLVCLFRNNGIYAVGAATLCLAVVYRRQIVRLTPLFGALALTLAITGPGYAALGIAPSPFRESVGIPIQQLSFVVANGGDIADDQRTELSNLFDLDRVAEKYNPESTNPVKYDPSFSNEWLDSHKAEFLKLWMDVGLQNPLAYIEAWLRATEGYWNMETSSWVVSEGGLGDGDGRNLIYEATGIPLTGGDPTSSYGCIRRDSPLQPLFSLAAGAWLTVALAAFRWIRGQRQLIVAYVPFLALAGTMLIAAPYFCEFRYLFPLHLALPLLLASAFFRSPESGEAQPAPPSS